MNLEIGQQQTCTQYSYFTSLMIQYMNNIPHCTVVVPAVDLDCMPHRRNLLIAMDYCNKKHLKNVGPIR